MSSSHPKTWQSYNDQVEILLSRGLVISDRALALDYLERIGYYRLSGYWFPFWELTGLCCQLTQEFKKPDKVKAARIRTDRFIEGLPSRTQSIFMSSTKNCECSLLMPSSALRLPCVSIFRMGWDGEIGSRT